MPLCFDKSDVACLPSSSTCSKIPGIQLKLTSQFLHLYATLPLRIEELHLSVVCVILPPSECDKQWLSTSKKNILVSPIHRVTLLHFLSNDILGLTWLQGHSRAHWVSSFPHRSVWVQCVNPIIVAPVRQGDNRQQLSESPWAGRGNLRFKLRCVRVMPASHIWQPSWSIARTKTCVTWASLRHGIKVLQLQLISLIWSPRIPYRCHNLQLAAHACFANANTPWLGLLLRVHFENAGPVWVGAN